jgi:hypothetical protein
LKAEAPDRTVCRTRFGRGYGPIVRQTAEWMSDWSIHQVTGEGEPHTSVRMAGFLLKVQIHECSNMNDILPQPSVTQHFCTWEFYPWSWRLSCEMWRSVVTSDKYRRLRETCHFNFYSFALKMKEAYLSEMLVAAGIHDTKISVPRSKFINSRQDSIQATATCFHIHTIRSNISCASDTFVKQTSNTSRLTLFIAPVRILSLFSRLKLIILRYRNTKEKKSLEIN